jgi:hypothetical protein
VPVLLGVLVFAAALGVTVGLRRAARHDEAVPQPPAPRAVAPAVLPAPEAPPAVLAVEPPPATVRFELTGTKGAKVFIDEEAVGAIPLDLELPAREAGRTLAVRAPGFQPFSQHVPGSRGLILEVNLSRRAGKAPGAKAHPQGEMPKDPFASEPR